MRIIPSPLWWKETTFPKDSQIGALLLLGYRDGGAAILLTRRQ